MDLEKEYTVHDYKFDYLHNLRTLVIPYLRKYEAERIVRLILAIVAVSIIIGVDIGLLYWYYSSLNKLSGGIVKIAIFIAGFTFVAWKWIQAYFEYKLKLEVMPTLMAALPGFEWQIEPEEGIEQKVRDTKIFFNGKIDKEIYTDGFVGIYRDVQMDFFSSYYKVKKLASEFEFNGPLIRIKMYKPFVGATVIRPNTLSDKDCSDLLKAGLQKVELEDIQFNKSYVVYSTDQVEARYLLTTGFMERFKNVAIAYDSPRIFCSFYENYLYIAPYTNGDVFSLFGLTRSLTDIRPYNTMFEQVASILSMVDYLKLDKNLGL